ncbi:PREDICTED: protein N-terminal glutamine amidohydrolase-like [Branchiostoma belcheri]|uniref:Protein N-terminal glutamine amidohydrolase n=1 Tax=Branchiostoma belcheri TaxID=7741 RepID=A0A6P4YZ18_BRABE|nr:PREDICTED: protein N-terminal glutamine amidohydrolase-like [Branchiostoma belcheri]
MAAAAEKILPSSDECVYTACYCEENIYKLCEWIRDNTSRIQEFYVVFISNSAQQVPLWMQKAGRQYGPGKPVVWDYHVILLHQREGQQTDVYDLDSMLPFPCNFSRYCTATFHSDEELRPQFHRKFRVVPATDYLMVFASDRSHMRVADGWMSPPPEYPCIRNDMSTMNLPMFIDMTPSTFVGEVLNLKTFRLRFRTPTVEEQALAPDPS